jgi:hypothetical protein
MYLCQPQRYDQFGPIFPTAANDNLPCRAAAAHCSQALAFIASEPTAFFLYLFAIGFVVASGYSLAIAIAIAIAIRAS